MFNDFFTVFIVLLNNIPLKFALSFLIEVQIIATVLYIINLYNWPLLFTLSFNSIEHLNSANFQLNFILYIAASILTLAALIFLLRYPPTHWVALLFAYLFRLLNFITTLIINIYNLLNFRLFSLVSIFFSATTISWVITWSYLQYNTFADMWPETRRTNTNFYIFRYTYDEASIGYMQLYDLFYWCYGIAPLFNAPNIAVTLQLLFRLTHDSSLCIFIFGVFIFLVTFFFFAPNVHNDMRFLHIISFHLNAHLVWFIFYIANFGQLFAYFLIMLLIIHVYVLMSFTSRLVDSGAFYPKDFYSDMFLNLITIIVVSTVFLLFLICFVF